MAQSGKILAFVLIVLFRLIDFSYAEEGFDLAQESSYGDYTVRIYRSLTDGYFEILQDGRRIHVQEGLSFKIGYAHDELDIPAGEPTPINVNMGTDITGNGVPDLVVSEWTGGAHCCLRYYIFELGKYLTHLSTIDCAHSDIAYFSDLDNDSKAELVAADWTFAYWKACFACSPAPKIILVYGNGNWHLGEYFMLQEAPDEVELRKIAQYISRQPWNSDEVPPVELWKHMLDLIYSGHLTLSEQFLDWAWPVDIGGKEVFRAEFFHQLSQSPYWSDLKKMNGYN